MPRLRTPDGRSLPASDARVRVAPPAGRPEPWRILSEPRALQAFVQAEGEELNALMLRAETDEALTVEEQHALIQSVLLRQALILGLAVYTAEPDQQFLELLDDLNTTLNRQGPATGGLSQVLATAKKLSGLSHLEPVALIPDEWAHVVGIILERAQRIGVEVDQQVQVRLTWAGYQPPSSLRSPLIPLRAALAPPSTRIPDRMSAEQELRALAQSPLEGERNAALLLLTVNARDRLENAPLIGVLDLSMMLLLTLRSHHQRHGTEVTTTDRLMHWHTELHDQLGQPSLPEARRFKRQGGMDLERMTHQSRRRLRALRAQRLSPPSHNAEYRLRSLWMALDSIEASLEDGVEPEDDLDLRATMVLNTLLALSSVARVPGMSLPVVIELAVRLAGIDPLWAWEATQPAETGDSLFNNELIAVIKAMAAYTYLVDDPVGRQRSRSAVRLAAGHLLATARRAGLRLPEQSFLETYFQQFGSLQALPLTAQQKRSLMTEVNGLLQRAMDAVGVEEDAEGADEPLETTEVPAVPTLPSTVLTPDVVIAPAAALAAPEPDHVRAARALLSGRRVVILGGVPSPEHHAALVRTLDLAELDWIGSADYAHGTHAHAHVTDDTALVILAIRWMGHAHNALREVARDQQVPYVMHPGGLSPSSVAWQIMHQVSRQLSGTQIP